MKILCRVRFDTAKDAGALNGSRDTVKEWCAKYPDLRPCGKLHGWVYKARCKKCRECERVVE